MKRTFRDDAGDVKADLTAGSIVVRMTCARVAPHPPPADDENSGVFELWLHIGLMYYKPYRPTFMEVVQVPPLDGDSRLPDQVFVKARCDQTSLAPVGVTAW